MAASKKAVEKLRRAIDKNYLADVKTVLKAEGNNAKDVCLCELASGGNALHYAASLGHVDIMSAILDAGVDVNSRRTQGDAVKGMTALHDAVNELQPDAVRFLLRNGADVNNKDDNGVTAIHVACRENALDILQELFAAGGDVNITDNRGTSPLLVSIMRSANECGVFLLNNGAVVQMTDKEGSSPLHYASEWECVNLVKEIVACGADVNLQDDAGNTPLHVTSDEDIFDFLVEQGADPTLRNKQGRAARDQRLDMEKEEFANINQALSRHSQKMENQKSHSARLQHAPVSRIFSPGPPIPETELRTARTNMLKELQKRTGFEGPAAPLSGQEKSSPRTPRSTGAPLVSPLAREAVDRVNSQLSKTTISTAK